MITLDEMKKKNTFDELFDSIEKGKQNIKENPITEKAWEIIKSERILPFFQEVVRKYHVGDSGLTMLNYSALYSIANKGNKIHVFNVGSSGTGKSHLCEVVLMMMPQNKIQKLTGLSGKALLYLQNPQEYYDKVLYIDEFNDSFTSIEVMKTLTSNTKTKPRYLSTDKINEGAMRATRELNFEGDVSVIVTSVQSSINPELSNRFIVGNTNESEEIDKAVYELQRKHMGEALEKSEEEDEDVQVIRRIGELVLEGDKKYEVVIPFYHRIQTKDKSNRRDISQFLTLIKSITILYRFTREATDISDKIIRLIATEQDFEIARIIWGQVCQTNKMKLGQVDLDILNALPAEEGFAMSNTEISENTGLKKNTVRNHTKRLYKETGLIDAKRKEGSGNEWFYWRLSEKTELENLSFYLEPLETPQERVEPSPIDSEIPNSESQGKEPYRTPQCREDAIVDLES